MLSTYSSNLHFCRVVGLLSLVGGLATCYILATALNSPDELWGTGGGVLTVFGWVFVGALFSYVKVNFKIYIQLFFCRSLCFFYLTFFLTLSRSFTPLPPSKLTLTNAPIAFGAQVNSNLLFRCLLLGCVGRLGRCSTAGRPHSWARPSVP